ncbi:MAG: SPOR domain-containing protein [Candidatus Accumulibacter phosphatis]|jgi:hypothetical protein|uniref:Sporulation related domain protein n=3 Tax=Candidatus Accumulibacter TaxID=327159 RepID=A0A080LV08_9PROT|nr:MULTISPECIES: SPOR domain-containing protein [Candidatus Accumulibacter]KFB72408.1 MAG: Sporulation related domain protein [Candidatus Accumulibacter phosphatis]MBL8406215.1 SPOR domain-containing protein [Accumulibacter sp.]NMQ03900.1 SPOR domain-containing protein [Candidatus Accumulibacter contiguus]
MIVSMRLAVFLLILANLLFFVWARGYLGTPASPDARRLEQQLLADQVRVLARGEPPRPASREAEAVPESKDAASCQLWSELASAEADQIERLLGEQFADFKATRRTVAENSGYWVFVPPLANKEEVSKKTAELQQLGIQDYFVVQASGPNQLAISLGTYRTEEAANAGLATLQAKGVKSARMAERKGRPPFHILEIRGPEAQAEALRQAIVARLPKASPVACRVKAEAAP